MIIFRRRQQQQQNLPAQPNNQNGQGNGAESPDMDFLEMDFDPGDESDTDDAKSYIDVKSNEDSNSTPEVPVIDLRRPQELRLDLIEEPSAQGTYCFFDGKIVRYFFSSISKIEGPWDSLKNVLVTAFGVINHFLSQLYFIDTVNAVSKLIEYELSLTWIIFLN